MAHRNGRSVEIEMLFIWFREEEALNRIIRSATLVLAKGLGFYAIESGNRRSPVLLPEEAARVFVDECMEEDNNECLTVTQVFERYREYCQEKEYPVIPRLGFTEVVNARDWTKV